MKYLKVYEAFDKSPIDDDVDDILLELTDNGFVVNLSLVLVKLTPCNKIRIYYIENDRNRMFEYDEVADVVERLERYLGDKVKSIKFSFSNIFDLGYQRPHRSDYIVAIEIIYTL